MRYPLDNKLYGHGKNKTHTPSPTIQQLLDLPKPEPINWFTVGPNFKLGLQSLKNAIYSMCYGGSPKLAASEFAPNVNCYVKPKRDIFVKGLYYSKPIVLDLPSLAKMHGIPGCYPPPFDPADYPLKTTSSSTYVKKTTLQNKLKSPVSLDPETVSSNWWLDPIPKLDEYAFTGLDSTYSVADHAVNPDTGSFSVSGTLTTHFSNPALYDKLVHDAIAKKQAYADALVGVWNAPIQPAHLALMKQNMSQAGYAALFEAQFIPTAEPSKASDIHQDLADAMGYSAWGHAQSLVAQLPKRKPEDILDSWAAGPRPRKKFGLWPYQQIPKPLGDDFDTTKEFIDKYYAPPKPPVIPKDLISDPSVPITGKHADLVIMDEVDYTTTAHKSQGGDWSELEAKVLKGIMEDVPFKEVAEPGYTYVPPYPNPCSEIMLTEPEPLPQLTGMKWYAGIALRSGPANEATVSDFEL